MKKNLALLFLAISLFALPGFAQQLSNFENSEETQALEIADLTPAATQLEWLRNEVAKWQREIPLKDPYQKMVNNTGDGDPSLYGTRNFRAVLAGVYYRGGGNNYYLKPRPRENINPLPEVGLKNLCQKGFAKSFYLYSNNFKTASPVTRCTSQGQENKLEYKQVTALRANSPAILMQEIYKRIKGQTPGPLYGHCWNGWHASGYIAALALQQFCHWSKSDSLKYWIQNTDGNNHGYYTIKNGIQNFKVIPELEISAEERQLICPSNKLETAIN
jgi:hypothetical protein